MAKEPKTKPKAKAKPKLVKMSNTEKSADVHPDEVKNFEQAGWVKK